ncbi:carboxypeptidase regulatory-like domain-containing protein [Alicyclobacillus macrosporangiidus]|uniref:40-residue YVTN family beta-propeller repeat-containing protein n=1 Tax=Alicyclobacillus macrosporangiidus TaxID=392015 RepID=A0A1I7LEQ4_9BACL|nr:carboxypeptidase regulatory-like domain-containing protein [Alicyclobacillus macrosporangiidus]SFV08177.1 40-residue YVTN family beta-propeller repeat-containing protein [Alicyclobacillus macrosporangiidus]
MKSLKVRLRWRRAGGDDNISRLALILAAIGLTGAGVAGTWVLYAHGGDKQAVAAHDMAEKLWGERPPDYVVTVKDGVGTVTQVSPQAPVMTVTLTASSQQAFTGQSVTLTATASKDVNGYVLEILDQTTGQWVGARVTYGTTDTATVSEATPGSHTYVAYIVDPNNTSTPVAESAPVTVTWIQAYTVSLSASASTVEVGGNVTLTATANQDVAQHTLVIVDETTGEQVGAPTTSGMSAQAVVSQTSAGTHTYVALIQDQSGTLAESQPVSVTWAQANVTLQVDAPQSGLVAGKTAQVSGRVTLPDGTPVPGTTVTISATGGTITPAQVTTDTNGNFTATYTAPNTQGTYKITASCNGSTASTTVQVRQEFTVTLQASETALPIGQSVILTATSNQDVAPYSLSIVDETNNQVVGGPVTNGTSVQAVVSQTSAGTHTYVALIQDQSGTLAESQPVSVAWAQANVTLTINAPQSGLTPGQSTEISGRVTLPDGTPVPGVPVTVSATGGTVTPAQVTTDANGDFTATYTAPDMQGTYTVTVTCGGGTASTTVQVRPAFTVTLQANETALAIGQNVTLMATVNEDVAPYSLVILDETTGQVVGGPVTSGRSVQAVVSQSASGTHTYVAIIEDQSGTLAESQPVSVTWAQANVTLTINVPQSGLAPGQSAEITGRVTLPDGTPVSGVPVTICATGGNVSPAQVTTDANGNFTATYTAPDTPGTYTVTVEVGGASSTTQVSVAAAYATNNVDTITLGTTSNPRGIAYGNGFIYVANAAANTVSVIDVNTNSVVSTIPVGTYPCDIAYGNGFVYVVNVSSNTVSVINATTNKVVKTISVGSAPTSAAFGNGMVYVTNSYSNTVSVINATTNAVVATVAVGNRPNSVTFGNGMVYVVNGDSHTVSVIDPNTNKIVSTIPISNNDSADGATYANGFLYIAHVSYDTVTVVDTATNQVVATISVDSPGQVAYGNGFLYVTNVSSNSVSVIDPKTNQIVATVPVGKGPMGITCVNGFVYVTNFASSTVSVLH